MGREVVRIYYKIPMNTGAQAMTLRNTELSNKLAKAIPKVECNFQICTAKTWRWLTSKTRMNLLILIWAFTAKRASQGMPVWRPWTPPGTNRWCGWSQCIQQWRRAMTCCPKLVRLSYSNQVTKKALPKWMRRWELKTTHSEIHQKCQWSRASSIRCRILKRTPQTILSKVSSFWSAIKMQSAMPRTIKAPLEAWAQNKNTMTVSRGNFPEPMHLRRNLKIVKDMIRKRWINISPLMAGRKA